jgi:curved DNA-binding protein CbpA
MSTPLPPDPYVAFGLGKDATPSQIKTTYRKLVLKCHPDKVVDESKKAEASDQFHRIQQAYEILSDEGRRSRYDAHVKMAELRKQNMSNRPTVEVRTAAYEVPTSGPNRGTFTARGPERVYEERRPDRSDSDDYFGNTSRTASRKHDDYERQPAKKTAVPLRDDKERARVVERERRDSERVSRTDKRRTRDQDVKRERDRKYVYDDESDTDLRQEAERRRRATEDAREKEMRERERVRVDRDREREREREVRESSGRDRDDYDRERSSRRGYDAQHYSRVEDEFHAYTGRDKRPSLSRSTSTATKTETYVDRSSRPTPAFVRRHSAKPAASPQSRRERDRRPSVPDIVEADEHRSSTRPTTLYSSMSSPSAIKIPRDPPPRSASMRMEDRNVPPLPIRRSETMPDISPKRAKDFKPSNLRDTDLSGGYPTPVPSPDYPSPTTSHKYHYPRNDTSSSRDDVDYRRTVDRDHERDRDRARRINHSPEPMREPIRSNKSSAAPRYAAAPQPPRIVTNQSYSGAYTTESPTPYSSPRPSPVRRETQRSDYDSLPRTGVPKANSSAKYEHSFDSVRDHDKDRRKGSPIDEYGYSSYRTPTSATRPHLRRQHTSDYPSYARGTTVA